MQLGSRIAGWSRIGCRDRLPCCVAASAATHSLSRFRTRLQPSRIPEQLTREEQEALRNERRFAVNIYVGNLPFTATEADLRDLFADYGEVTSAAVITDRDTGRSRGFGFVELADEDLAGKAVGQLDGRDLDGRHLKVNKARPRPTRS